MHLVYDDSTVAGGASHRGGFNASKLDPTPQYIKHLHNYFYLKFIFQNSDDWAEKRQAEKEIGICERKMDYWYKMSLDMEEVRRALTIIRATWKGKADVQLSWEGKMITPEEQADIDAYKKARIEKLATMFSLADHIDRASTSEADLAAMGYRGKTKDEAIAAVFRRTRKELNDLQAAHFKKWPDK
jgi:hypothetical protein